MASELLTVREAARAMGRSTQCVYSLIKRGKLAAVETEQGLMVEMADVLARCELARADVLPKGGRPPKTCEESLQELEAARRRVEEAFRAQLPPAWR